MTQAEKLRELLETTPEKQPPKAAIVLQVQAVDADEDPKVIIKSKRSTKAGIMARLEIIEKLMLKGWSRGELVRLASENWQITSRQVENYTEQIREQWAEARAEQSKHDLELAIIRREMLYKKTLQENDKGLAVVILNSLDKIKGLFVDRVESSGEITGPVEVKFADIDFEKKDTN